MTDAPVLAVMSAAEPAPVSPAILPARPRPRTPGAAGMRLCRWRDASTAAGRLQALGINATPVTEN